jgi:hypothetical protein
MRDKSFNIASSIYCNCERSICRFFSALIKPQYNNFNLYCNGSDQRVARQQLCKNSVARLRNDGTVLRNPFLGVCVFGREVLTGPLPSNALALHVIILQMNTLRWLYLLKRP